MTTKALAMVAVLAAMGWMLSQGTAHAKGPVEVVIAGGDLAGEVTIPVGEVEGFFPGSDPDRRAPSSLPPVTYDVDAYQVIGDERSLVQALTYYPAHGDQEALLRPRMAEEWVEADPTVADRMDLEFLDANSEKWYGIDGNFEDTLNRYIASAAKAAPATEGTGSSGGLPAEGWYAIIGAALALVLLGGGIAARRLTRPQPSR